MYDSLILMQITQGKDQLHTGRRQRVKISKNLLWSNLAVTCTAYILYKQKPNQFYLEENVPNPFFSKPLVFLFQWSKMFGQWRSLDQLHHDVQFITWDNAFQGLSTRMHRRKATVFIKKNALLLSKRMKEQRRNIQNGGKQKWSILPNIIILLHTLTLSIYRSTYQQEWKARHLLRHLCLPSNTAAKWLTTTHGDWYAHK